MIAASLIGADALTARLSSLPVAVMAGLAREIGRLGRDLQDRVERKLAGEVLQRRSGRLAASIAVDVRQSGNAVAASIASNTPYVGIQEYGGAIPAHPIGPAVARVLRFPGAGASAFSAVSRRRR